VHLQKIRRCSNPHAIAANALSKAQFPLARAAVRLDTEPAPIPITLLSWIDRPNPSDDLAHLILKEIAAGTPILNYSC
jgi:hypothetical protein